MTDVRRGGFAEQAGMVRGDLILTIAGAPVLTVRELAILVRSFRTGTKEKLRFVRDVEVLTGSGTL